MAFTRNTTSDGGLRGTIVQESDGRYSWNLKEQFTGGTVDAKTGDQEGALIIAKGGATDYDSAVADLKAAFTAAG